MIGLSFLAVGLLWLAFSWYLATRLPKWLGISEPAWRWVIGGVVMLLLLVGPFVDQIVGMRQFESLCKQRAVVWTSTDAKSVNKAIRGETKTIVLPGYWIVIRSQQTEFLNAETGKPFLKHELLHTKGGHFASLLRLGNDFSCSPAAPNAMNDLDIDKLIKQGQL